MDEKNNTSPVGIAKPVSFGTAMDAVAEGLKVRRPDWPAEEYGILKDGYLTIFRKDGKRLMQHRWIVNDGDVLATDWVIF